MFEVCSVDWKKKYVGQKKYSKFNYLQIVVSWGGDQKKGIRLWRVTKDGAGTVALGMWLHLSCFIGFYIVKKASDALILATFIAVFLFPYQYLEFSSLISW